MFTKHDRAVARRRRHRRVRVRVTGTANRPRMCIHRSLHHITAQLIDDVAGHTLLSASTNEGDLRSAKTAGATSASAAAVGKVVAERAKAAGIVAVVFDRGGYLYHGRVKALADAARSAGLEF